MDAEALKAAEDAVGVFINGGQCTKSQHPAASSLELLVMMRQLRLLLPYQSTNVHELDETIRREAKRNG